MLKFLHKLGFAITADCIGDAAAHENIEIMQWALDSGVGKVSADITGQGVTRLPSLPFFVVEMDIDIYFLFQ